MTTQRDPIPAPDAFAAQQRAGGGKSKAAHEAMQREDVITENQRDGLFALARDLWGQLGNEQRVADTLWGECQRRFPNMRPNEPWRREDTDRIAHDAKDYVHPVKRGAFPAIRNAVQTAPDGGLGFTSVADIDPLEAVPYGGRLNIPLGTISILTGQQGVGKGLLMVSEAARLSRDGHGVLIASDEDSIAHTIVPRLIAGGADRSRIDMVNSLQLPTHAAQLAERARANNVRLVIIDPWTNHMGDIDVNKGPEVRDALMALKAAAQAGDFSVLLIAHPNKNSMNPDPLERIAHSSALSQVARSAFWIVNDPRPNPGGTLGGRPEDYKLVAQVKQNLTRRAPTYQAVVETRSIADAHPSYGKPVPVLIDRHEVELDWLDIHKEQQARMKASRHDQDAPAQNEAWQWLRDYLESAPARAAQRKTIMAAAGPHLGTGRGAEANLERAAKWARREGLMLPDGQPRYGWWGLS